MIKTKLINIVNSIDSLKEMSKLGINGITSYKISKLISKCMEEYNNYDLYRNTLIDKYGELNDKKQKQVKDKCLPAFYNEINEFLNVDIELLFDKFYLPISILENSKLEPMHFINTSEFIEFIEDDIEEK